MEIIQIIIILFALFALSRSVLRFKDKNIDYKGLIFWGLVWCLIIVVVIIPKTGIIISNLLVGSNSLLPLAYLSTVLLFYLVFRLYVKLEGLRQENTLLVREIAKQEGKKKL